MARWRFPETQYWWYVGPRRERGGMNVIEPGEADKDESKVKMPFGFSRALYEDERPHASGIILPPGVRA